VLLSAFSFTCTFSRTCATVD